MKNTSCLLEVSISACSYTAVGTYCPLVSDPPQHMSALPRLNTLQLACVDVSLSQLQPGSLIKLPIPSGPKARPSASAIVAADACTSHHGPHKGIVAVKVQYPDAYPTMALDLGNVKAAAQFLQRTEIKFDLTSAVTELAKQIKLEFDFVREATIMDQISSQLLVGCQSLHLGCF